MTTSSLIEELGTPRSSISEEHEDKKQKGKMRATNVLQQIFHTKNQSNSLYYFTRSKSVASGKKVIDKEPARFSTFEYPEDKDIFAYHKYRKALHTKQNKAEIRKKFCCKTNARTRARGDILERLYVEDPEDIKGMKTLLDIDPEFFTITEGRPIQRPFLMSKYMEDIKDVLRTKLMTGFRNDEMLLINEKLEREKQALADINHYYNLYLSTFENLLSEDYNESMNLLREAEKSAMVTMEKTDLIKKLHNENASLEFTVHKLEERWRDLKMYQKFLYFVSPMSWRKTHDYIHRKELENDLEAEASSIFKKYRVGSQGYIPTLNELVEEYLETIANEEEPKLYFTDTKQLIGVFRFIEIQNLNCLLHTEEIEIPIETMKKTMDDVQKNFENDAKSTQKKIDELQQAIEWEEECAQHLKNTAIKQIDTTFRALVSDDEILKLIVYIQDVYETCVAKSDSEIPVFDMMTAIEQQYNNLILKLDGLPQAIVKKAEKSRFAEQAHLAKLCKETQQKIAMVESITWRLRKNLEPPYVKKRDLMFRSPPKDKPDIPLPPPRDITENEKNYLTFFTEYCALMDRVEDYGIELNVDETNFAKFSGLNLAGEVKPLPQ